MKAKENCSINISLNVEDPRVIYLSKKRGKLPAKNLKFESSRAPDELKTSRVDRKV
jgi:hypothetical protein